MRAKCDRITTTIEREWLANIIAGNKKIEYRQIKPYWTKRFERVSVPFELRLLNGMNPPVPEVTVLIHKITKDRRAGDYQLHIKKVLGFKHWDKRRAPHDLGNVQPETLQDGSVRSLNRLSAHGCQNCCLASHFPSRGKHCGKYVTKSEQLKP
jgi:hypothetical protein